MTEVPRTEAAVTLGHAAELLDVSESTIRADKDARRLPVVDLGRGRRPRWMVRQADIDRLLAEGGRSDRRTVRPSSTVGRGDPHARDDEMSEVRRQLAEARSQVRRLEVEVARLRTVAVNANAAVQAQTQSVQEYLIGEPG